MTTINSDLRDKSLAEVADHLEAAAQKNPVASATTTFDVFNIGTAVERQVEEAAEMVRLNGGTVAYTRSFDGTRVQWNRLRVQASNSLTAWFFRELIEIDRKS